MHQVIDAEGLCPTVAASLNTSLTEAESCGCHNSRAAALRKGLEEVHAKLAKAE